jgi:hypothetical protein
MNNNLYLFELNSDSIKYPFNKKIWQFLGCECLFESVLNDTRDIQKVKVIADDVCCWSALGMKIVFSSHE